MQYLRQTSVNSLFCLTVARAQDSNPQGLLLHYMALLHINQWPIKLYLPLPHHTYIFWFVHLHLSSKIKTYLKRILLLVWHVHSLIIIIFQSNLTSSYLIKMFHLHTYTHYYRLYQGCRLGLVQKIPWSTENWESIPIQIL